MAKAQITFIITLFLFQLAIQLTTAHYLPPKPNVAAKPLKYVAAKPKNYVATKPQKYVDLVVEGVVYCQSCDKRGMWSLTGAKPIEKATISVICKDHRNRVIFYNPFKTNKDGYFYAQLKGFKVTNPFLDHPLQTCKVKLVSSPLKECNVLTNVNYGLSGAPLKYQDKRLVGPHYKAIIYGAAPLAFRPAKCTPKPKY
ncbi:hypothetical protein LIER_27185 [Lithospermum erythrorhizon]|uniref:Uncharacterized protein n=1 Tax=Lithospermum erythrorhizon TaxID=34254 RepID=A0AAV3RBE2_LITER